MNSKSKIIVIFIVIALLGGAFGGVGGFLFAYLKTSSSIQAGNSSFSSLDKIQGWLQNAQESFISPNGLLPSYENMIISVVEKATPSVVSIVVSKDVPVMEQYFTNPFENVPPEFKDFLAPFGWDFQIPQERQNGTEKREIGGGTGFIVSADGLIITNKHVVSDTDAEYTVFTNDGEKYEAKVLARDRFNDLAILKIEANDLPILTLGNSDDIKIGQTAIAIGFALGEFQNTVSKGIISGLSRSISVNSGFGTPTEELTDIIQTDLAINFGNSGGPLLDINGQVMGINVAKAEMAQGIGFALPINLAKKAIDSYNKFGKITAPYLGIWYEPVTEEDNLAVDYGVVLKKSDNSNAIMKGSPAEKAGLKNGDIILEFGGQKIDKDHILAVLIKKYQFGDSVMLKVLRDDQEIEVVLILGERPEDL